MLDGNYLEHSMCCVSSIGLQDLCSLGLVPEGEGYGWICHSYGSDNGPDLIQVLVWSI